LMADSQKLLRPAGPSPRDHSLTKRGRDAIFEKPFGGNSSAAGQSPVLTQLPEVEMIFGRCVADFHDRTKLHYVQISPIMHKMAAKLFVEDFGTEATLKHYERLVASLTSDGTLRESQFESFKWPDAPPQDVARASELDSVLWQVARDLIAKGILKETIASALVNISLKAASHGLDPLVSAGFLITALKDLRAGIYGIYTPQPEIRPEIGSDADEGTKEIFNRLRDFAYMFKERSGLEWHHQLPCMQRVCVIYCIKYRGKDRALELFRDQVRKLDPLLEQCQKNPPQEHSLTPLHITHMANFKTMFLELTDSFSKVAEVHPVIIALAISTLITELATKHYDLVFLSAIVAAACTDIEEGRYNFVKKTH
jgi:hypothetical protein